MVCAWNLTTVGQFNDDACYILQARHVLTGIDYGPWDHLPGQGLVLLPAVALFPHSLVAPRVEGTLLTAGAVLAWSWLASAYLDAMSAALIGTCFACSQVGWVMGSTVMSDGTFALLIPLVLGLHLRRSPPLPIGLLLGLAILCRAPGVLLAVVVLGDDARRRDGRRVLGVGAGLVGCGILCGLIFANAFWAFGMYRTLLGTSSTAPYFSAWGHAAQSALESLVGYPTVWWLAALAFPASLAGVRRAPVLAVFAGLYGIMLLEYPYVEARFIWVVWPLVLLLAMIALPVRGRWAALGGLLCLNVLQLPAMARGSRQAADLLQDRWASFQWLSEHAAGDKVVASMTYFVMLRSGVTAIAQRPSDVDNLVAQALETGARYIYIDPTMTADSPVTQAAVPPRLDLWLDRNSAVQKVFQTPWDRVYRVTAPTGRYLAASRHEQVGQRLGRPDELRLALQQYPDLPGARVALARDLLRDASTRSAGEVLLQGEIRQYPVDTSATLLLATQWQTDGRTADARALLQSAMQRARQEGRDADAARLGGV
jgi:hypothetical protein